MDNWISGLPAKFTDTPEKFEDKKKPRSDKGRAGIPGQNIPGWGDRVFLRSGRAERIIYDMKFRKKGLDKVQFLCCDQEKTDYLYTVYCISG